MKRLGLRTLRRIRDEEGAVQYPVVKGMTCRKKKRAVILMMNAGLSK